MSPVINLKYDCSIHVAMSIAPGGATALCSSGFRYDVLDNIKSLKLDEGVEAGGGPRAQALALFAWLWRK
jgi:hypothetical protein